MQEKPILVSTDDGGVTVVTIHRPQAMNALSLAALDSLRETFLALHNDKELKCVILTGAGQRSFAAGGDLKELDSFRSKKQAAQVSTTGRRALDAIRHCPAPVYAAINGHALGGGAELAMACDFRIASANATIGFLQGKLNVTTSWGGGADLISVVGASRALELLLSSQKLNMAEAKACGLIDQIVPDGDALIDAVRAHAARYLSKPAHVIQGFTRVAHAAKAKLRDSIEPVEFESFVNAWVDDAHWEATAGSLQKSPRVKHQQGTASTFRLKFRR